jgi:uncharacterized protein
VKTQLATLVSLQITDTEIRIHQKYIESADQKRAEIEREFEKHASSIREIQNKAETAKAEKAKLEKDINENKTQLERADRNLKNSQNQKEYEASMRETDVLQRQIAALEAQIVEKLAAIEETENVLAERKEEIESLEGNLKKEISAFESELAKNAKALKSLIGKREEVFKTVPAAMSSVYNRLVQRSRDGIAVAEVKNDSCSSCFMKLRPQKMVELRRGTEIIKCESCTRILYILSEVAVA